MLKIHIIVYKIWSRRIKQLWFEKNKNKKTNHKQINNKKILRF